MSISEKQRGKAGRVNGAVGRLWGRWQALSPSGKTSWGVALLVAIGVVLRLWHYAGGRSFFIDEAYIAANFFSRSYSGLLDQLDFSQTAPVGWLFLEKWLLDVLSWMTPEYSLRLPSIIAGVTSMILFGLISRRYLEGAGAIAAVLLFALSDQLIIQSAMVKHYAMDVLFMTAAMWAGGRYFVQRMPLSIMQVVVLAVAGLAAIPFSFPAAFALGSLGSLLFLRELMAGRRKWAAGLVVVGLCWLALFGVVIVSMRSGQSEVIQYMQFTAWDTAFAPFPPFSVPEIKWYVSMAGSLFHVLFQPPAITLAIFCLLAGAVCLFRRQPWFFSFLVLPVFFAFAASVAKYYPFSGRLLLFAFPLIYFLVGEGAGRLVELVGAQLGRGLTALMLIGGLSAGIVLTTVSFYQNPRTPFDFEDLQPAMKMIADSKKEADAIYVFYAAYPAFRLYQDRTGLEGATIIQGSTPRDSWGCYFRDIERMRPYGRVWMVITHTAPWARFDEFEMIRYLAQQYGEEEFFKRIGHRVGPWDDVKVLLYDFTDKNQKPALPLDVPENADEVCIKKGAIS